MAVRLWNTRNDTNGATGEEYAPKDVEEWKEVIITNSPLVIFPLTQVIDG
jgi:hypothetical protein